MEHAPTRHVAPAVPTNFVDTLEKRTGTTALALLTLLLWVCAIGLVQAAVKAPVVPAPNHAAEALPVTTSLPMLRVAETPAVTAAAPYGDLADFALHAGKALARDEAESALLKLSLAQQALALLAARLQ